METGSRETAGQEAEPSQGVTATDCGDLEELGEGPGSASEHIRLRRGDTLGRYLIVNEIGSGGSGIVYSAFDPDLDRKVALKVLRKSRDPAARARLLREAQAMAKLADPHVVTIFEVDTDSGRDFVVMEFVDGQDLDSWAMTRPEVSAVLSAYRQAGQGLAAAHRVGLVHRDFKPHNVLIDRAGRVRVTDFGLARQTNLVEELSPPHNEIVEAKKSLTRTGAVMGTPAYMAPEQHLGEAADVRSDQYSFCVALYEALAGQRPFGETSYAALKERVTAERPPAVPESVAVSARIRSAVLKGMARSPEARHDSMDTLLLLLRDEPRRRGPLIAVVAMALVALALAMMLRPESGAACETDRSVLDGSWDEEIRGKVRTAFAMTQVEGAAQVFGKFESILDDYGERIVDMRREVCEASRGSGKQSDEVLLLRVSCLQKRRQELAALTSAFSNVDPRGVDRVVEAALGLPAVAECADTATLQRGISGPEAEDRAEVKRLQASLKEAESLGEAGRVKDAIARAEAARERSLAIGYLPLRAESHAVLGHLYGLDLQNQNAEQAFEEAILAAEESGYTEYRARALAGMTRLVAGGSSRYKEARRYARRARAAIAQWSGDAALSVDVDLAMATIFVREGKVPAALQSLESTLRSYRAQSERDAVYVARLQNGIAGMKIETGDYESAHELARSSYDLVRNELGESNPRSIAFLATLSSTHRMRGEYEEARKLDRRLRAYWASDKARAILADDEDYNPETRSIRGRILDARGQAVSGATVVCAKQVVGDARFLDATWGAAAAEASNHYQSVRSGREGMFECRQASTEEIVVVADHATYGRSPSVSIAASSEDHPNIDISLAPTGFLTGAVTKDGRPGEAQSVTAVPRAQRMASPPMAIVTFLRGDGTYSFERLAPGHYQIFSGPRDSRATATMQSKDIVIESGEGARLDFDQSKGDGGLRLRISGKERAPMPSAQVVLVPGHIESTTGKKFNEQVIREGLDIRSFFWSEGEVLEVSDLNPGSHSLCIVPLGGDYRDPEYMQIFKEEVLDKVPLHCQDLDVRSGETLSVEAVVPGWVPLVDVEASKAKAGPR